MLTTDHILILVAVGLLLTAIGLYLWLRQPPKPEHLPPSLLPLPHKVPSLKLKWNQESDFNKTNLYKDQSPVWRASMLQIGRNLKAGGVKQIYFLHGTFAGSDPFNVLPPLKILAPALAKQWEHIFERKMKEVVNTLARDIGNFLPEYVQLFHEAIGELIPCHTLHWSSTNHHWSRLHGAIRLIEDLHGRFPKGTDGRILLIGHSHARQVFALFTHLITESSLGQELWAFIDRHKLSPNDLRQVARLQAHGSYDFVTLGSPLRYPFAATESMRFLQIVNHRGSGERAENLLNPWMTAGGDYVQQWGGAGSDVLATTGQERGYNRELDKLLGKGIDTRVWVHHVASRERVSPIGQTLLVDYRDHGRFRVNCIPTVFGHGIYTRYRVMLFNMSLVSRYLYEKKNDS